MSRWRTASAASHDALIHLSGNAKKIKAVTGFYLDRFFYSTVRNNKIFFHFLKLKCPNYDQIMRVKLKAILRECKLKFI